MNIHIPQICRRKAGFFFNTRVFTLLILIFSWYQGISQHTIVIDKGDLKAVFVDNNEYGEHHHSGYNGIAELYHVAQDSNLFVPLYAGVNLEHIFDGDSLVSFFEPRKQPMTIEKISSNSVLLHQPPTTISHVENWTLFEVKEPHYIDVEFSFIVHDREMFNHGYVGFFWASYINDPGKLGINFIGHQGETNKNGWMYVYSDEHGKNSTHVNDQDTGNYYIAPNFNITLVKGISDYTYTSPFYYGRFHNMVFAYLLPKPENGSIRLSQSPSGGGKGKPAWDFHYILPDFELGKKYTLRWRVLYKEWSSRDDIEKEYQRWISNN